MAELEDMINSVLSDPEQMSKIAGLAQSLMGGSDGPKQGQNSSAPIDSQMLGKLQNLMGASGAAQGNSESLLRAMQPYLSEKRRVKMDKALKLARMARLAGFAMEELGGDRE